MTKTETEAKYRALRDATCRMAKVSRKAFDDRAACLAHELSDGEQIEPSHWLQAAVEIESEVRAGYKLTIKGLERAEAYLRSKAA